MSIIISVVMYFVTNMVMDIINIYELGLKEYEKIKKEKIIAEIKKDMKNEKSNIEAEEISPNLSQL